MNLRCMYCQTMFGLSRENMLIALQAIEADGLSYFEFHCPKCRRANRVERKKLEMANPGWKETVKTLVKDAPKADTPTSKPEKKPATSKKAEPAAKNKKPTVKKESAAEKPAAKKKTSKAK